MRNKVDKKIVEERFKKSMSTYDDVAIVQQQMACRLVEKVGQLFGSFYPRIFEIGAGTGLLTKNIVENLTFNDLYANDLVEESNQYLQTFYDNVQFIHGDIEAVTIPDHLDLIISNASLQWVENFPKLLENMHAAINENGLLAFSTFGIENYREVSHVTGIQLNYFEKQHFIDSLSILYDIIDEEDELIKMKFDSPIDVLRHIKMSGTNSVRRKSWGKKDLKEFHNRYSELFKHKECVELTYHPYYFLLKKKKH